MKELRTQYDNGSEVILYLTPEDPPRCCGFEIMLAEPVPVSHAMDLGRVTSAARIQPIKVQLSKGERVVEPERSERKSRKPERTVTSGERKLVKDSEPKRKPCGQR